MNYFTPERYLALQNFANDEAMDAADAAWEEQVDRYEAYLQTVRPSLPPAVTQLLEGHFLHDAAVLSMGRQAAAFVVVLQLDTPPHDLLTISYSLSDEPTIQRGVLPPEMCSPRPAWLSDELAVLPGGVYQHSILLSNGWEVQVRFRDVQLTLASSVFPVKRSAAPAMPGLPVSS